MELTNEQTKQMQRVFPNGWEETDIPTIWRNEALEAEDRIVEEIEDERFAERAEIDGQKARDDY